MPTPVTLVSGAAGQLGALLVDALLELGHRVMATDHDLSALEEETKRRLWPPSNVQVRHLDVTEPNDWRDLVDQTVARWGHLDVLVHCAAYTGCTEEFLRTPMGQLANQMEAELLGPMLGTRAAARTMVRQSRGTIIAITRAVPVPETAIHGATRQGLEAFCKTVAKELAPHGVDVCVVEKDHSPKGAKSKETAEAYVTAILAAIGQAPPKDLLFPRERMKRISGALPQLARKIQQRVVGR